MYTFSTTFPAPASGLASSSLYARIIYSSLASYQASLHAAGIASYTYLSLTGVDTYHILPSTASTPYPLQTLQKQTYPLRRTLTALANTTNTVNAYAVFPNQTAYYAATAAAAAKHATVGIAVALSSRLIPRDLFHNATTQAQLVDALLAGLDSLATNDTASKQKVELGIYCTTPANTPDAQGATAANPAWRRSLWHVVAAGGWAPGSSGLGVAAAVRGVMEPIIHLVGTVGEGGQDTGAARTEAGDGAGAGPVNGSSSSPSSSSSSSSRGYGYMNEGDWTEEEWQEVFYGGLYGRLEEVKREWDPVGVFGCWKCVGWTGEGE